MGVGNAKKFFQHGYGVIRQPFLRWQQARTRQGSVCEKASTTMRSAWASGFLAVWFGVSLVQSLYPSVCGSLGHSSCLFLDNDLGNASASLGHRVLVTVPLVS